MIGSKYSFDVSIAQLEILYNGQQVRTIREHSLTFPDFGLGGSAGATDASVEGITDAAKKLRGIFSEETAGTVRRKKEKGKRQKAKGNEDGSGVIRRVWVFLFPFSLFP